MKISREEDRPTPVERSTGEGRPAVIETRGLTRTYGSVAALEALDLTVPKNSIFGFLGPNGAGKTTAMKLLLGLTRPTSGSGSVLGHDILSESFRIRERVGYLAQDPRYYEHMTARETLRFVARFFYSDRDPILERRVEESLVLVGLSDRADRRIGGFSGGELQRLGLAQAQINDPELLILDEPAASLDPMGRRDVLELMTRLRDEQNTTIFYSTHILDDVQRVSDAVAILDRGRLLAQAPIGELLKVGGAGVAVYELSLNGGAGAALERARTRLLAQGWVSALDASPGPDGGHLWTVSVDDRLAAEENLLRVVLEGGGVRVSGFGRKRQSLEEAFFDLIEGGGGREV